MKTYKTINTKKTPQSEAIPGKKMVQNSAGGYVFQIDDFKRLDRFLILGTEGGTYYVGEKEITKDNAECVIRCMNKDGIATVNRIVEISDQGRAPKNDPALFALAMCAGMGDEATRKAALNALPQVARIGTHLFHFISYVEQFRGWGRGLSTAVKNWYNNKEIDKLAYDVIKYQSRDKWSHRDLLRLSHVKTNNIERNSIYKWVVDGLDEDECITEELPKIIQVFEDSKTASEKNVIKYIQEYNLPRECVPTEMLNSKAIWEALLEKMPMTAMIRNLATMTRVGLIKPLSSANTKIIEMLGNQETLKKARIHPITILAAMKTYESGHGVRGTNTWEPISQIIDALNDAFYLSFKNIEPTNKRWLLGLDVSGSMGMHNVSGIPNLTPREASAAMALVTANSEKNYHIMGFTTGFVPLSISPRQRLTDAVRKIDRLPFQGTDCALPMIWALQNKVEVDAFIIYTDNETWAGNIHPTQALNEYRQKMGIPSKLIVVGMTSTGFSIADPNDFGMMDVVGFDSAVPNIMADFVRG